jgi:GNAT superfamily N-acetyltransferase
MIKIIRVEQQHLELLFSLIEQMVEESVFSHAKPSRKRIEALFYYPKSVGYLAYKDDICIGFIGALIGPFFFSDYERATDLGFYILPEHRGGRAAFMLLRALENWVKQMGVSELYMGHSVGGKIEEMKKFYIHNGYKIGGFNSVKKL